MCGFRGPNEGRKCASFVRILIILSAIWEPHPVHIGGDVVSDEVFGVLFLQSLSVPSSFHFFFFVSKKIDGRVDLSFVLVEGNCEGNRVVDDVEGLSSSFSNEGFDAACHGASFDSNDFAGLVCRDKDIVFILGCFSECFSFVLW